MFTDPACVEVPPGSSHLRESDRAGLVFKCCGTHGVGAALGLPEGSRCICSCHTHKPLPREYDDTAHLKAVISHLAQHPASGSGAPLWSVVASLLACGGTMASRICTRFGFDASKNVIKPGWFDPEKTSVTGYCHKHAEFWDLEGGHCEQCAAEDPDGEPD